MSTTKQFPTQLVHTLKTHNGRLPTAQPPTKLITNPGPVNALTFSSSPGTYLLTGSSDRSIHLSRAVPNTSNANALPTETTSPIQRYDAHGYSVLDVAVAADNARFASVGGDRGVFLWDVEQGVTVRRWSGHNARIEAVEFAGEGDAVVVSGISSPSSFLLLVSPGLVFNTNVGYVTGSADTTINLWDARANTPKPLQTLPEATDTVSSLHAHMPSYSLASGSYDGRARVYDIRMGRMTVDVLAHPVTSVRCSADGNALLASTLDGRIRMVDRGDGKLLQAFGGGAAAGYGGTGDGPVYRNEELRIRSVFACGDAIVLSGGEADKNKDIKDKAATQAYVFAWDILTGEVITAVPAGEGARAVSCVAWNEKRGQWAGGCSDGKPFFPFD